MIKSSLKLYKKNIWTFFGVTGIVAIGLFVAFIAAAPVLYDLLNHSISRIISSATALSQSGFNADEFLKSITRQFNGLNWRDPVNSIRSLLDVNSFIRLFTQALQDSGFQQDVVESLKTTINECADQLVSGIREQLTIMVTIVGVASFIGFVVPRVLIQVRSTGDKNPKRFATTFFLNFFTVLIVYTLIVVCLLGNMPIAAFVVAVLAILGTLFFLTFLWPIIFYRDKKKQQFKTFFNIKTFGWYALSSLIVLGISLAIFGIFFLISDIIGFVIILPLIFVTNIIMENIMIHYVTNYDQIQEDIKKRKEAKLKKLNVKKNVKKVKK